MLNIPMTVITNGEEKEYVCTKMSTSIGYDDRSNVLRLINVLELMIQEIVYKEMKVDRMSTELFKEVSDETYAIEIRAIQDYQPHREEFAALLEYIHSDMINVREIKIEKNDRILILYVRKEGQSRKQFVFEYGEQSIW